MSNVEKKGKVREKLYFLLDSQSKVLWQRLGEPWSLGVDKSRKMWIKSQLGAGKTDSRTEGLKGGNQVKQKSIGQSNPGFKKEGSGKPALQTLMR
ncbi:hypothetical protein QUB63_11995 [Microcoleus sp. ARI1-B5]|uniref:hypothetical protein n=1 Tax=unclassified Microcoleus TaxID=2642155 RepID=UPI002FD49065